MLRFSSVRAVIFLVALSLSACTKDQLTEFPTLTSGGDSVSEFRLTTYNIHGGKGPNGEGNFQTNLAAFRSMLMGEHVICMQEVEPECWSGLKGILSEYPYRFYLSQRSTKFGTAKEGGNAVFSKLPIVEYDQALINTDPGGDKWERKAQYVKLFIGSEATYLNLFHYHNTYNWHNNGSEAERQGFERFVNWVQTKSIPSNEMLVLTGDFNLSAAQCNTILQGSFQYHAYDWVDHIYSNFPLLDEGFYNTVSEGISDHNAVWGVLCNNDCW